MENMRYIEKFYDRFYYEQFENIAPWHLMILNYLKENNIKDVPLLDIGCYRGYLAKWLTEQNGWNKEFLDGIDISPESLNIASQFMHKTIQGDVQDIDTFKEIENKKYQLIIATEIIEHVDDFSNIFKQANVLLESSGVFVVSFPNYLNLTWYLRKKYSEFFNKPELMFLQPIEKEYNYFFISSQLKKYGFQIVCQRGSLYLPGSLLLFETEYLKKILDSLHLQFLAFSPMFFCKKI